MTKITPLLNPSQLKKQLPLSQDDELFIGNARKDLQNILSGADKRFVVIVGPCSVHDNVSALEYATKMAELQREVADELFLVMRVYYEKSRTSIGWKGLLNDPLLDNSDDITHGLVVTRQLLLQLIKNKVPVAAELLEPLAAPFFSDLLTWGCIGARTSTSQIHRQLAASMPFPVGIKNSTDGNIDNAVHGVKVATQAQRFLSIDDDGMLAIQSAAGNPFSHVVLRGGDASSNNDQGSLQYTFKALERLSLMPCVLMDCSHGNSRRLAGHQPEQLRLIIEHRRQGFTGLRGTLLESHLFAGRQHHKALSQLAYGVSITDECLSWEETNILLLKLAEQLAVDNVYSAVSSNN